MMIARYATKADLQAAVGQPLNYEETSFFAPEYKDDGTFSVANRPSITKIPGAREFFAEVTMVGGLIAEVK